MHLLLSNCVANCASWGLVHEILHKTNAIWRQCAAHTTGMEEVHHFTFLGISPDLQACDRQAASCHKPVTCVPPVCKR